MSASKRYYWLKLHDDYFDNADIKIIEAMENGEKYLLFLFKLKLKSIKTEGYLRVTDAIPYNEKMLATITNTDIDIVRSAMKVLIEFKLIEKLGDETLYVKCVETLIGSETDIARRVRKYRGKKKVLLGNKMKQISNTDIESEKDLDKDLDKDKNASPPSVPIKKEMTPYQQVIDKYYWLYRARNDDMKPAINGKVCKLIKGDLLRFKGTKYEDAAARVLCDALELYDSKRDAKLEEFIDKAGFSYETFHGMLNYILDHYTFEEFLGGENKNRRN